MYEKNQNKDDLNNIILERGYTNSSTDDESGFSSFLRFRKLITFGILRIVYVLGCIAIFLAPFFLARDYRDFDAEKFILYFFIGMPIAQIVWRIFMEFFAIIFSIHDMLTSIEREIKNK